MVRSCCPVALQPTRSVHSIHQDSVLPVVQQGREDAVGLQTIPWTSYTGSCQRAGSSKSHDVHGVLFPGVQVEVRGVGRCVVLVPKLVNEQVQDGNQGVFLVVEHIANRAVWLMNPACIDRILPPCRTPNDPLDATPKAMQIIKHELGKLAATFPTDWPIIGNHQEALSQIIRESATRKRSRSSSPVQLTNDLQGPAVKIRKTALSDDVKVCVRHDRLCAAEPRFAII